MKSFKSIRQHGYLSIFESFVSSFSVLSEEKIVIDMPNMDREDIIDYLDDSQTYLASVLSPLKAHIHYTAGRGAIELGMFDNIHPFIQKQLIFDMIHSVIGYEVEISSKQVLAVWKLLSGQSGKQINLAGGVRFWEST